MSSVVSFVGAGTCGRVCAVALGLCTFSAIGGCSSDVERFSYTSFGSGYESQASLPPSDSPASGAQRWHAANGASTSYRTPSEQAGYHLASVKPGESGGYLQVAKIDLPPLQPEDQPKAASDQRTKYADGYGIYNRPPVTDGVYTGPRVFTPYDRPREEAPPPYGPKGEESRSYESESDVPLPPPHPYERPKIYEHRPESHAYEPRFHPEPRVYEPRLDRESDGGADFTPPRREPHAYGPRFRAEPQAYEPGPDRGPDRRADLPPLRPEPHAYGPRFHPEQQAYEPRPDRDSDRRANLPPRGFEERQAYQPRPFYPAGEYGPRPFPHGTNRPVVNDPKFARSSDPVASDRGNGIVVTVRPGETLYTYAIRYGVTVDMIIQANGLSGRAVKPGQDLLIPRAGRISFSQAKGANRVEEAAACIEPRCHVVRKGETVATLARAYRLPEKRIIEANNLTSVHSLKLGRKLEIPIDGSPARQAAVESHAATADNRQSTSAPQDSAIHSAVQIQSEPVSQVNPEQDVKTASIVKAAEPACDAALANPIPRTGKTFRKPLEGHTISGFGPQRDGTVNEGITISVPKGTLIKAAENGVVAYVGDELPGFGNLILIRHADDYVTAYAHADEILVKKCDVVKRGQVVAKAGATGDVNQPQLHFEIRKNSKPVDPQPLLSS